MSRWFISRLLRPAKSANTVRKRLEPLMRSPPTARPLDIVWVEPTIEAEVGFRGITSDGMLRHSFKGLKP